MVIASSELQAASELQETACTAVPPVIRVQSNNPECSWSMHAHTDAPRSRQEQGQVSLNTSGMLCPHKQMLMPMK